MDSFPRLTEREIENAIKTIKKGKAPSPEIIIIGLLKDAGNIIHQKLANIFTACLNYKKIPEDWNNTNTILIHKKGSVKYLTNN